MHTGVDTRIHPRECVFFLLYCANAERYISRSDTDTHTLLVNHCIRAAAEAAYANVSVNASVALLEKYIYRLIMRLVSIIHRNCRALDHSRMNRAGESVEGCACNSPR